MARPSAHSMVPSAQVAALLRDACQEGARLVVRTEDATPGATLAIYGVLPNGALTVEAPAAGEVRARLQSAPQLSAEYTVGGVQYTFSTRCSGIVARGAGEAMLLDAPRSLMRVQRRRFFRVAAAAGSAALVQIGPAQRSRQILDVSAGGIALKLHYPEDQDVSMGARLDGIELRIPGEDAIAASGIVRYVDVRRSLHGGQRQCGIELLELPARDQERLMRHAIRRERELIGRRHLLRVPTVHGTVVVLPRLGGRARVRSVVSVGAANAFILLDPELDRDLVRGARIPGVELRLADEEAVLATGVIGAIRASGEEVHCTLELRELSAADQERLARIARLAIWGTIRGGEDPK